MTDAFPHGVTVEVLVMSILAPGRGNSFSCRVAGPRVDVSRNHFVLTSYQLISWEQS